MARAGITGLPGAEVSGVAPSATGLSVLAAESQAALTALLANATGALPGLMSAPDKVTLGAGLPQATAATVQTTDATVTTIVGLSLATGKTGTFVCSVQALTADGSAGASFVYALAVRNNAGTLTAIGATIPLAVSTPDAALATAAVTLNTTGTVVRARVTGVAATTINWSATAIMWT